MFKGFRENSVQASVIPLVFGTALGIAHKGPLFWGGGVGEGWKWGLGNECFGHGMPIVRLVRKFLHTVCECVRTHTHTHTHACARARKRTTRPSGKPQTVYWALSGKDYREDG